MGHPVKRRKFHKSPTFTFGTRKLQGVPPETPKERSEMERLKAEWLKKHRPHK